MKFITALAIIIFSVMSVMLFRSDAAKQHDLDTLVTRQREFCMAVKLSVEQDRQDFESGDARRQDAAYLRFYEGQIMYHNVPSILMCVATVPELPLDCRLNKNWHCLADLARTIETSLSNRSAEDQ